MEAVARACAGATVKDAVMADMVVWLTNSRLESGTRRRALRCARDCGASARAFARHRLRELFRKGNRRSLKRATRLVERWRTRIFDDVLTERQYRSRATSYSVRAEPPRATPRADRSKNTASDAASALFSTTSATASDRDARLAIDRAVPAADRHLARCRRRRGRRDEKRRGSPRARDRTRTEPGATMITTARPPSVRRRRRTGAAARATRARSRSSSARWARS